MTSEQFTAFLGALTAFLIAASAAYVKIRDRLEKVHGLVNSQLEAVMRRLDKSDAKVEALLALIDDDDSKSAIQADAHVIASEAKG